MSSPVCSSTTPAAVLCLCSCWYVGLAAGLLTQCLVFRTALLLAYVAYA